MAEVTDEVGGHGAPQADASGTRGVETGVGVIAVVAVIALLKWSASVAVPVVFSLMLIALLAPLKARLARSMPKPLAVGLCLIVFVAGATAFAWTLAESADAIEDGIEPYRDRMDAWYKKGEQTLSISQDGADSGPSRWIGPALKLAAGSALSFLGGAVLVLAFLGLGLSEAHTLWGRLKTTRRAEPALRAIGRIGTNIRQYLYARTVVGFATGVLVGLATWALGLELAFVWGVTTFLLNYIPTLGSIVAVLPPAIFALLQFNDPVRATLTFGAVTGLQLVMGSYVDPLVEGRFVSLSPFIVLFSVVFWGWLWGIPGSFVGVPMTLALVVCADEFKVQRWLYDLTAGRTRH